MNTGILTVRGETVMPIEKWLHACALAFSIGLITPMYLLSIFFFWRKAPQDLGISPNFREFSAENGFDIYQRKSEGATLVRKISVATNADIADALVDVPGFLRGRP